VAFEAFPWDHMGIYPYQNNQGEVLLETGKGNPVLAVKTYGKGRVVAMSYPERGLLPRVDDPWETGLHYPYWEYMWSLVARSVIWASDKEPGTSIQDASRTQEGIHIQLNNVNEDLVVAVQIIDEFGMIEEDITALVGAKKTQVDIPVTRELNGGNHIANVQLKGKQGVYDWYSLVFQTKRAAEIISVENRDPEIPVGENVRSTIVLRSDHLINGTLTARLYDNFDRLVDEQSQEVSFVGEKIYGTVLNSERILTHLGRSEYFLSVEDHQTDHQVTEHFFLQPRSWDDYDVTMYHFGPNPVPGTWLATDRQLKELNVTTMAAYTLTHSWHANYKIQAQTRIQGVESPDSGPDLDYYKEMKRKYLETNDKSILQRKYGLKDTVYLNSVRDDLASMIGRWKKFSPSAYYIYEEPSVTRYDDALDLCFRESTLAAMREWLKEEYVSLPALNKQWGTDFSRWEDVVPDDSPEAVKRGNYSSWGDHRTFMEICWADQFKFVRDIVNELDPGGLVQLSGTQAASSHNGYDYSRLNQYVGQMNPYDIDNQLEYHHNFNPELKISGQAGYGALGKSVLYDYYNHMFLKETGGSYVFWQVSCLNPDLRICQSGLDMKEGFDELLKRGIGRLVGSYEPDNELKIAIHFSFPSIHGAWIVDGKIVPGTGDNNSETLKQFNRNRDGWVKVLHDAGLGFDFISYSSIEYGNLLAKGYKVLILPMSYALSDSEVQQIEAFVKQGGILIADALPGIMDDHTKIRSERALSDVFGIKARSYTREELITPAGESELKVKEAVILQNGKSVPEILYHNYGKGSAYLLNYFMDDYPEAKLNNNHEFSLQRIRKLFERENLESGTLFTTSTGDPVNSVEKYSFSHQSSSARLLGILPGKTGADQEINLHINQSAHLYDIRNKKYLGEGNDFKIRVKSSVPELFGLVQGTIDDIEVEAPSTLNRGETVTLDFKIVGQGASDLKSVVRVNVFNPEGVNTLYYSDNCEVTNGSGTHHFNTALNDQPGLWKIQLTEVISGVVKEVTIRVIVNEK
ncbi:MAG: beta-galactosidase trimerization domain-containing protein, partial [Bacteroidales bacterium]